jgi:hypothetical protein
MAGRRTFFSFHYQRDIWRATNVRNSNVVTAKASAGWTDASIWEEAKKTGRKAVEKLIDDALRGTSVTVVLIGAQTYRRKYIEYEIEQSVERGNGMLGIFIHKIADQFQKTDVKGPAPQLLLDHGVSCRTWDRGRFQTWVEQAAIDAGHKCLEHGERDCAWCRLALWVKS